VSAVAVNRRVLHSLLVAGMVAVAPHALELPPWVIAVFAAGAGWRYLCERLSWPRPGRLTRTALMLVILAAVFRQYHTLLGRDPGMALLVTLLGLKFLEIRNARDYIVSLFLFYLVILGSFLYSQTLWLGAWALLAVTLGTAALIHLIQPTGLPLPQRLRLSGTMLVKALPLMVIVYLLFPRISGTLWGLPADAYSGLTGMPDAIQPGSIRSLSQSSEIAFRATFDGALPPMRDLYWRGLVLEHTDGRGWNRIPAPAVNEIPFEPEGQPQRYQVTLEASNKPWMLVLGAPTATPPGARLQSDFTLVHNGPIRERLNYTLTSYLRYRTGTLDAAERARDLQLPPRLSPRVRALAAQWRGQGRDALQVARAALDYFHRENFVYTLDPPLLGDDPVDQFLFDARRGFCEHYASAFVTLMRAAGVPSRLIVGYLGGEINSAGNYLIVRQSDAHAWAEIWTPDLGWVRADPTAAVAPERVELGSDAVRRLQEQGVALGRLSSDAVLRALQLDWPERAVRQARWYWDLTNLTWYRWVVDYGKERQERFLASLGVTDISWNRMLALALGGVLLVTLLYVLLLRRPEKPADPALVLYLKFCRKLARAGLARAPHEGPLDFARRCSHQRPELMNRIEVITRRYTHMRYGQMVDAQEWRDFKNDVAAFRV
jgi:transglutaminase-like putative cysteine protease